MALPPRPVRTPQRLPPRRSTPPPRRPVTNRRRSRWGSPGLWLIVVVLAVVGGYVYKTVSAIGGAFVDRVDPQQPNEVAPPPLLTAPFNVLLLGVDWRQSRPDDGARADTMIVVHVDPQAKTAAMLSIPRDTAVEVRLPDGELLASQVDNNKINAAYMYGYSHPDIYATEKTSRIDPRQSGATLAQQAVEQFLGITIDYYAQVDFQGFQKLIDELGGITLDVPHAILDAEYPTDDDGYMRLYIPAGLQRMDGITALRYARTRHADNDFGRGKRQQQVLQAVMDEVKQRDLVAKVEVLPALLQVLNDSVKTTLPINNVANLKGLAQLAKELPTDRITRYVLEPGQGGDNLDPNFDNRYDIHWKDTYIAQKATQLEQGRDTVSTEPETALIQVQNGTGEKGVAGRVTLDLKLAKLTTTDAATAPTTVPHTQIVDYTGKPVTRRKLAQMLGIKPESIIDKTKDTTERPFGVDIVVLLGADYDEANASQSKLGQ